MNGNNKSIPLVSVIINCYNGEKHLREAIDSVYNQTYKNWEIIFWDNLSNDSSAKIAKSYDEKLKYFLSDQHTSLGEARNKAIKKSNGEYIAFIDVDDIWFKEKLEKQIISMKYKDADLSYTDCLVGININNSRHIKSLYPIKNNIKFQLKKFEINLPTSVIKKNILSKNNLNFNPNIIASEEYDLFIKILLIGEVDIIRKPLSFYRISNESLTNKSIKYRANDRIRTLTNIRRNFSSEINSKNILKEFNAAKYKIWYYKFQYHLSAGNKNDALLNLRKIYFKDFRYLFIYIITFVNINFYKKLLKVYDKRGIK